MHSILEGLYKEGHLGKFLMKMVKFNYVNMLLDYNEHI